MEQFFCLVFVFVLLRTAATVRQASTMLPSSPLNLPSVEIEALQSLYDSTNGPNWAWRGNSVRWNFSGNPNPCSEGWYGVQCTAAPSGGYLHLQKLTLTAWKLAGTLPEELAEFEELTSLELPTNRISGTVPPELGSLTQLQILDLDTNDLTGTLPPELGSLTQLNNLDLDANYLTGTLPPELGNMTRLQSLYLHLNLLNGTLPPELGSLTQLNNLDLDTNDLTGTLPPELGNLTQLQLLDLYDNHLTGTLPPELGNLTQLLYLYLDTNHLTGTLPPELGNLTQLLYLYLNTNHLIGTLPQELGSLSQLLDLDLYDNHLTGTLPPELGRLTQLQALHMDTNHLTGTLPPALGSLSQLLNLYLNSNQLTGTLPLELASLTQLHYLYLYTNHLSGTLPPALGSLTQLLHLNLDINHLTGTLPPELASLTQLLNLNLDINQLTGTLPSELGNLTQLQGFSVGSNHLTGTLPPELSNLALLLSIDLGTNRLTGTLPVELKPTTWPHASAINLGGNSLTGTISSAIFQLPHLQYLNLSSNLLTETLSNSLETAKELSYVSVAYNHLWGCLPRVGAALQEIDVSNNQMRCSLEGVVNSTKWNSSLLNVQLGNNQFTGTLPAVLFSLPKLKTLMAVSNCFTGTLPQEICQATVMRSLILDGVGASRFCPTVWTTWQREGQLRIPNRFHGTIPECVFSLPALTSLHLSGNNLIGTIPDSVILGGNLTQLYLSHNLLTGSIPEAVQTHAWSQLDLSYNRFSGSLLPSFGEGTLQGPFNATASVVVNNSRLSGEIPATLLQLPQVSMLGTNMFSCKADKSDVPNTDGNGDKQRYQCGSDSFNYAFYLFLGLAWLATAVLLLAMYVKVSENELLKYLNKWRVPLNTLPASCQGVFAMISVLCQVAVYCCVPLLLVLVPWYSAASHYYGTYTHQYAWVVSAAFLSGLTPGLVELFLWTALILLTYFITTRTNEVSIDEPVTEQGGNVTTGTSSYFARTQAYALFLGVNFAVVIGANIAFVYVSLNESSEAVLLAQVALSLFKFGWNTAFVPYLLEWISKHLMPVKASSGFFRVQAFVGLFNNIAIPCLVVAAESPSCFRDLLLSPAAVTSDFSVQRCRLVRFADGTQASDCSDPTLYSLQSSFVPQFSYSYECSSSFVTYYSAAMVYFALTAAVLVPAVQLLLCWLVHCTPAESRIHQWSNAALPRLWRVPVQSADSDIQLSRRSCYLNNADNLLVNTTVFLGILLSFGMVFPPVALAMCVAMLSTAYQTRLAVGRLLFNAREVGAQHVVEVVEQDCRGVASLEKLQSMVVMAIMFACYFYALFIFDTIGDAEGFAGACWVLALWVVVPLCATAYIRYRRYGRTAAPTRRNVSMVGPAVELVDIQDKGGATESRAVDMEVGGRQTGVKAESEEETVSALHA